MGLGCAWRQWRSPLTEIRPRCATQHVAQTKALDELGWARGGQGEPKIERLREYLRAQNGIRGLLLWYVH